MATRRERVVLELEDNFSSGMAKAAASAALLKRELNDLDGTSVKTSRSMAPLGTPNGPIGATGRQSESAGRQIDRLSGRLTILAQAAAVLGPSLIPIGAVGIPALTGLAAQFGAAALAGGTAVIAFQGVGTALEAVNKAALEPTTENLEAARVAMGAIGPEARAFVTELRDMVPAFQGVRNAAAAGLFPGLTESLGDLESMLPRVEQIVFSIGDALGDLAADSAESLAGPRWAEFLAFIETEIPSALTELGQTLGNLTHGLAEMWMAFTPLNNDFSSWMLDASASFDEWAEGLSKTEGFEEFVAYVRANGPKVADAMESIGNALLQVVEAAAPLGGPVLEGLAAVADVIASLAGSKAGPAIMTTVGALALLSRGMAAFKAVKASDLFTGLGASADGATRKMSGMQRAAVGLTGALAALAVVDAVQGGLKDYTIGVQEMTAALLALESGGANLPSALDGISNSIDRLVDPSKAEALQDSISNALGGIGNEEEYDRAVAQIEALDAALTGLVLMGEVDTAKDVLGNLGLSESQMSKLMSLLPGYKDALAGVGNEAALAGGKAADGFDKATSAAQRFRDAVIQANNVLTGRATFRDYEAALDDLAAKLKEVGNADLLTKGGKIDISLPKGREVQAMLDNIAGSAIKVAENLKGADRVRFLARARKDFVDVAADLLGSREAARKLANELGLLNGKRVRPKIDADDKPAKDKINSTDQLLAELTGKTATPKINVSSNAAAIAAQTASILNGLADEIVYIRTVRTGPGGQGAGYDGAADGMTVPGPRFPYGDKDLYRLAPGEEVISNRRGQADRNRAALKAANAGARLAVIGLANGGTAGYDQVGAQYGYNKVGGGVGSNRSIADQLAIAQMMQQIRQLQKSLRADGKDKLNAHERKIAQLEMQIAEKELRLLKNREEREARQAAREDAREQREKLREKRAGLLAAAEGLSFDSIVPDQTPVTVAMQVAAEIEEYKKSVLDAGGKWTKAMQEWADGLTATANQIDHLQGRLEAETAKRDALVDTLAGQQQALDQLNATMQNYAASVAGNYLSNPFNQSFTRTVGGGGNPAQAAALAQAQAQLAAIRSSSGGDSVAAARAAADLIRQIAVMQESLAESSTPVEETVSGLKALRETLTTDTDAAQKMADALAQLEAKGLDTTGALGGLYQELAASGDLQTAQELAALTSEQIAEYEAMWVARAEQASLVAAQATQAIYGEQQIQMQAAIAETTAAINHQNFVLEVLNMQLGILGEDVRAGAEAGAHLLQPQLRQINQSIKDLARRQAENKKKERA